MLDESRIIRLIFAFKIRYLRQQKGFAYQELAKLTGLSTSYLNDIEKGKRYPKPDKIAALAGALGVDYDYLVATTATKEIQPIVDLLTSKFLKLFPLQDFGISVEKLIELFTQTPKKVNAFISTLFKIARNYQIDEQKFYLEALRSYQDMHNNYFPELEQAVKAFKREYSIEASVSYAVSYLEEQLQEIYGIRVNKTTLAQTDRFRNIRSYYSAPKRTLYLNKALSEAQQRFLIARELGFQYLKLSERPFETTILQIDSFEKLLNNYRASHFAAALLMDEDALVEDIRQMARESSWHPDLMLNLLDRYGVTAEMLLQRLTNILPHHFGLEDLFFMRLTKDAKSRSFSMTKNLHLSQLHSPYNNELDEHYCHRWVSISVIEEMRKMKKKKPTTLADAQISRYWNTDKAYLCFSLANQSFSNSENAASVTLGLLLTPQLRSTFNLISDPQLKVREVHTTCERCGIEDCQERVAAPVIIEQAAEEAAILAAFTELDSK